MKKAFKFIKQISIAICCLFLFTQCDETRYIDEADIPKIKPGGVITLQGVTPDGKKFNFTSTCPLLGIRKTSEGTAYGLGPQVYFKGNFQTVGKSENLILDFNFETQETYLFEPSFDCNLTRLTGSFSLGNRVYYLEDVFRNKLNPRVFVNNLTATGEEVTMELTSTTMFNPPSDTFKITIQSILLP
jgi:hypothetical protein